MLDQNDIKQIGEVVEKAVKGSEDRVIQAVGEMLEQNVMPVIDTLGERLDKMEGKMDKMESGLTDLRKTVANLPDKDYLDEKIANVSGEVVVREKKIEQKINLVANDLEAQHILHPETAAALKSIQIFPPPPQVA